MSRGPKVVEIVEDSLEEYGITDVDVLHTTDGFSERLTLSKEIGENTFNHNISFNRINPNNKIHKELALEAKKAADNIEKNLSDYYEWDGHCSKVSVYDGGWAECRVCGEKVETPPQKVSRAFKVDAELSTPNPLPKEPNNYVNGMSANQEVLLRMYLLGRLRDHCSTDCPNSNEYQKT